MRQVIKTFTNSAFILKPLRFGFATQTKNVFTLPKKQNINPIALGQLTASISEAYTVRMLAYLFRDNIKFFYDLQVSALWEHIVVNKLEVDDTLNSIIVPITIEYVNSFTIQNGMSLGSIATCAALLNVQHDKFWESVFNKLDNQNIYKYLTLRQTVDLLNALVEQGIYINHPLIAKLSGVVAQQKSYYQAFPDMLSIIHKTNKILQQKGPKTLQITEAYKQVA